MAMLIKKNTPSYTKNVTISKTGNVCTERIDANGRDWMEFIEEQGRIPIDRYVDVSDRGKVTEKNFMDRVKPEHKQWLADEIKKRRMAAIEEMEATKRQKPQSKAEERFAETMTRMVQMSAVKLEAAQAPVPKAKTEKTV